MESSFENKLIVTLIAINGSEKFWSKLGFITKSDQIISNFMYN